MSRPAPRAPKPQRKTTGSGRRGPVKKKPRSRRRSPGVKGTFETVKSYIGFTPEDSKRLAAFYRHVEPHLDLIIDDFYARIQGDPGAAATLTGGEEQIRSLKETLRRWLQSLLKGPHGKKFAERQAFIGKRHVQIGLDQAYTIAGIHVFREHLSRIILEKFPPSSPRTLPTQRAVVKILDLVTVLIMETYRDDHAKKVLMAEQNARIRRLASLGQVAASVAHEIRNPLAGISGAMQILASEIPADDPRSEILKQVDAEIRRLDERVHALLQFARPAKLEIAPAHPRDLFREALRLLDGHPGFEQVSITMKAPASLPRVQLDAGLVKQVLVNLLLNAAQAMGGNGRILLTGKELPGGLIEMAVEDSGPGVPRELADKIFQPFFTTRPQGTGLGLGISQKIIVSHGGSLELEEGRGGSALFVIRLPRQQPMGSDDAVVR